MTDRIMTLLTTAQAAARLGITPGLVARYVRQGRLTPATSGRANEFTEAEIDRFAAIERVPGKGRSNGQQ